MDPVDPIEHLDFESKCDWQKVGQPRCPHSPAVISTWSCGCVMLSCRIHGLAMGGAMKTAECLVHGAANFVSKTRLEQT